MDQVSHSGRRKPRPWTDQEQVTAEVAAACGVSLREIGRLLNRTSNIVTNHLCADSAEKNRKTVHQWRSANPEKSRKSAIRWYYQNLQEARNSRRLWRQANPDKVRENMRRWCNANLIKLRERRQLYRKLNIERIRERDRKYYAANAEKSRKYSRCYREANAQKVRESIRCWRKANPQMVREAVRRWRDANRVKFNQSVRRRNAWKRAARQRALLPVTSTQLDARFSLWRNRCAFCGVDASHDRNRGYDRLTVEHVLALTKGGLDEASNIIPACSACNSSKNNSAVEDWYRRQPFFTESRWRKIQQHCLAAVVGQLPLALSAGP